MGPYFARSSQNFMRCTSRASLMVTRAFILSCDFSTQRSTRPSFGRKSRNVSLEAKNLAPAALEFPPNTWTVKVVECRSVAVGVDEPRCGRWNLPRLGCFPLKPAQPAHPGGYRGSGSAYRHSSSSISLRPFLGVNAPIMGKSLVRRCGRRRTLPTSQQSQHE
jgi:hypothetical protein